jgi:hypothetical protein
MKRRTFYSFSSAVWNNFRKKTASGVMHKKNEINIVDVKK